MSEWGGGALFKTRSELRVDFTRAYLNSDKNY